eukprot:CCRYP_019091-RA/>CCRYP_019091-RA protein AED:0.34 eAED:0.34 QI:127/1/1/1/0.5/0.66/3/1072/204
MGNEHSSTNRMAISAMSHMMKINKRQLLVLRDHCVCISEKGKTDSGYQISRSKLLASTTAVNLVHTPDYEVLEKLLILWDKNGTDRIDPLLFLAGVSPLASVMDVTTKLRFAFEVFDYKQTGTISRKNMESVLSAINKVSSFFGDAVLHEMQIGVITDDMFQVRTFGEDEDAVVYADKLFKMAVHPLTVEFVSGLGTARYGTVQ